MALVAQADSVPAVTVRGAVKQFGPVRALDGVDLEVPAGENLGLLGPNGSGKTTLIRAVVGVLRLDAGTVHVMGERLPSRTVAGRIGYMTQSAALYEDLTVRENLRFFGGLYGLRGRTLTDRVDEVLALVRLEARAGSVVRTLSGGMRQRTNLAAVLLHRPRLLLLDEPTVGVDPELRRTLWDHFHRLNRDGVTLIVSTHIMDEAERCGRIAMLQAGRVLASGTPGQVKAEAAQPDLESAYLHFARTQGLDDGTAPMPRRRHRRAGRRGRVG